MVEETEYGRGFRDGIKDVSRRIEEARDMSEKTERKRIIKIIDLWVDGVLIPNNSLLLDGDLIDELKNMVKRSP